MEFDMEPDMQVLGEAEDGFEALDKAEKLHPQVVVMDIKMPRMDGIAATTELCKRNPGSKVVMISLYDDRQTRDEARVAGATALVSKCESPELLLEAIRTTASATIH